MVSRCLVTTALEITWPSDNRPILFLGEWCRLYDRKHRWGKLDALVVPYHWDDREKLHRDYLYLKGLHEQLLIELAEKLNAIHDVSHSVRYWRIVLGPWLGFFVQMLFDRWEMLCRAVNDYDISLVTIGEHDADSIVPNDMSSFVGLFVGDIWNDAIYGQLLEFLHLSFDILRIEGGASDRVFFCGRDSSTLYELKHSAAELISRFSGVVCSDSEYFFISSYLPIRQDFLLQIKLGQLPKLWRPVAVKKFRMSPESRQWRLSESKYSLGFESAVRAMIPRHIPKAYLEGYESLVSAAQSLYWPKRPKVIFTSNSYFSDEVFKVWAADKVENECPLIIGQHGGNFGMAKWSFTEDHQTQIADKFLTWGWRDDRSEKVRPVGNFKGFGKRIAPDESGVALLVQMAMPRYSYHMYSIPVSGQWLSYFDDQCRFLRALPSKLQEKVLVRLYAHDYGWCQKKRWMDCFPSIQIDDGLRPIASLMAKSRLYISTYNATTYLESLSLNFPTLIFWNERHSEFRPGVEQDFEALKSVGIFHDTPESAAHHMQSIWGDVSGWWSSPSVQSVRQQFCERFALIPEKPIDAMETVFREIADMRTDTRDGHIDISC